MKKIHHFIYTGDIPETEGAIFKLSDIYGLVHQIRDVLRLKKGEQIALIDPAHHKKFIVSLSDITHTAVFASFISAEANNESANAPFVHLFVSVLKKDAFELVTQKVTEVGCARLTGLLCAHTVKTNINEDRVKKISMEATEQSQQLHSMEYQGISDFSSALTDACEKYALVLFFDTTSAPSIASFALGAPHSSVALFIGPEGGWSDKERELVSSLKQKYTHLHDASLAKSVLKGETAALVSAYYACQFL